MTNCDNVGRRVEELDDDDGMIVIVSGGNIEEEPFCPLLMGMKCFCRRKRIAGNCSPDK